MKLKNKLLIVISLLLCFSFTFFFASQVDSTVNADAGFYNCAGLSYKTETLLTKYATKNTNFTKIGENTNYATGRTIRYRLTYKDGKTVTEGEEGVTASSFTIASTNYTLWATGIYTFEIFDETFTDNVIPAERDADYSFNVESVDYKTIEDDEWVPSYKADLDLEAYKSNIATNVAKIENGETKSFYYPSLENLVYSKYFDYDQLSKTIYYSVNATSYKSTSSSYFTTSGVGYYSFYVLFGYEGNAMTLDGLTEGPFGWYKEDDTNFDNLIIPIFTFSIDTATAPEIDVGTSEDAYINYTYTISCFTITSDNYQSVYKLYYSENYYNKDDETTFATAKAYEDTVLANATEITDDETYDFDSSDLTFNVAKKGYYYVFLRVVDDYNLETQVVSRAISAQKEFKEVETEKEFFKNNLTSFIFLGISILCLIAIIIILCIKPKDAKKVAVKE